MRLTRKHIRLTGLRYKMEDVQNTKETFKTILDGMAVMSIMDCSFNDLAYRIRVCIDNEQKKPFPDNDVISVLCDSARAINELLTKRF